jgi:hypothetical protein
LAWKSYDGIKLGILLYLYLPSHRGATLLYKTKLHEHLDTYRESMFPIMAQQAKAEKEKSS